MNCVKKNRKSNFSDKQLHIIVSMFADNKIILLSKQSTTVINEQKATVWQQITDAVNASSHVQRTINNCKKKWLELKRRAILCGLARNQPRSGDSTPPEEPWYVNPILDILGEDSSLLYGTNGGLLFCIILKYTVLQFKLYV